PTLNDPLFQKKITFKKEFLELAGTVNDKLKTGEFLKYQTMIVRLMTNYDRIFLNWSTGTGKSFSLSAVAEYFHNHPSEIRHVIVIVPGRASKTEIRKQLVCSSPLGKRYITASVLAASKNSAQQSAITRALKEWYTIITFGKLANKLKNLTNYQIEKEYSGCLFFFDETQNIRLSRNK